ncbi:MAG: SDR family NAD(P)-dependent oxidoreductase [Candidatus Dormibacteraceae bacterium]
MRDLSGGTALLTGASGGIGPFIARRLAAEGVKLILVGRRPEPLQKVAEEAGGARVTVADLARRREAARVAEEAGAVDIVVANAGLQAAGRLLGMSLGEIDAALEVNLRSAIVLTRLLLPGMVGRRRGHVVLIGSLAGKIPGPGASLYNATKFALRGFGLAVRQELRGSGVGVSVINPTFVREAGMWARGGRRANPIAREVAPTDVADAVVRGIREDRSEIDVAPLQARLGVRLAAAFPELAMGAGARAGAGDIDQEGAGRRSQGAAPVRRPVPPAPDPRRRRR